MTHIARTVLREIIELACLVLFLTGLWAVMTAAVGV